MSPTYIVERATVGGQRHHFAEKLQRGPRELPQEIVNAAGHKHLLAQGQCIEAHRGEGYLTVLGGGAHEEAVELHNRLVEYVRGDALLGHKLDVAIAMLAIGNAALGAIEDVVVAGDLIDNRPDLLQLDLGIASTQKLRAIGHIEQVALQLAKGRIHPAVHGGHLLAEANLLLGHGILIADAARYHKQVDVQQAEHSNCPNFKPETSVAHDDAAGCTAATEIDWSRRIIVRLRCSNHAIRLISITKRYFELP